MYMWGMLLLAASSLAQIKSAAKSSLRPLECRPPSAQAGPGASRLWRRARHPNLTRYCRLVARGYGRLKRKPAAAAALAKQAQKLMPRLPGGYLLAGKAQVAQSKQLAAAADFKRALAIDSNSLRHPEDLHAYARLQTLLGHHKRALKLYRRLIPQTNLLSAPNARSLVLLQAAHLLIRLAEQNPKEKSARHNEALNYLRAAQRGQQSQGFRRDIALSLVVLLDDGKKGVPSALLSDELGLRAWARRSERAHAYASPWAALAMKALALEGLAPKSALRHWRKLRQRDDLPRDRLAWVDARVQILQKKRRRRR